MTMIIEVTMQSSQQSACICLVPISWILTNFFLRIRYLEEGPIPFSYATRSFSVSASENSVLEHNRRRVANQHGTTSRPRKSGAHSKSAEALGCGAEGCGSKMRRRASKRCDSPYSYHDKPPTCTWPFSTMSAAGRAQPVCICSAHEFTAKC